MIEANTPNVRSMLLSLGVGRYLADIAIPYVWFIPGAIDPDSAPVIELIKALQRGLKRLGYANIKVNGVLDKETAIALDQISPPKGSWMQKTFVQLLGDVLSAIKNPTKAASKIDNASSLDGYFEYEGLPPGPLPGSMVGLPPGPLGMGATAIDEGVSLEFGQGIRNRSVIVPIPKRSGPTYSAFKQLQRQINRLLSKHPRGGRVAEDGILGNQTFSGLKKAQDVIRMSIPGDENTLQMAKKAVSIASILASEANAMGIPQGANRGATSTKESISEPTPKPMTPAQVASFGTRAAMKKYLPFFLGAAGIAWYATTKKQKKRKR